MWMRGLCAQWPRKVHKHSDVPWIKSNEHMISLPLMTLAYKLHQPNLASSRPQILQSMCLFVQVPSGFFITDALLSLDRRLGGGLLVPAKDSKQEIAAREAKRLKRLMSALRHLYRNST